MRVLHLLDTDGFAGTERHVLTLVEALKIRGVDALVGCVQDSALHRQATARSLATLTPFKKGSPLRSWRALDRAVRDHRVDVVHAHNGRTALWAALLACRSNVTPVMTQHFIHPQHTHYRGPKRILANWSHRWVQGRMSRIIAVSEAARQAMRARGGIGQTLLIAIPNGIHPPEKLTSVDPAKVREAFGIPVDALLVVTLARLEEEKGLSFLVSAAASACKRMPSLRFVVLGEGRLRDSLVRQAEREGVAGNILWPGFRPDAQEWLAAADLFVLPSLEEPFGLAILEAMSFGKAVVATDAGGPREIIDAPCTGLLVRPADAAALGEAILRIAADASLRAAMGNAGRDRFNEMFTADRMAGLVDHLYREVCRARSVSK